MIVLYTLWLISFPLLLAWYEWTLKKELEEHIAATSGVYIKAVEDAIKEQERQFNA